jgi:5-methylcytosine-specific restriction enzyme subunit McrC
MTSAVELREWETIDIELSPGGARLLADLAGSRLTIGVGSTPGTWSLSASSHVGAFVTPEIELLVRPKVPMHNLFQMLDVGLRTATFDRNTFSFGSDRSLLAAIAELFARSIERAVGTGLVRSYRAEHERLFTLRGRVDVGALTRRPGLPAPIPCTFDEYTADILENRALKAALRRLLRVPGVRPMARRSLSHTLARFEEVAEVGVDPEAIDGIVFTRLNRHYRNPLRLASLILRNLSLIDRVGSDDASAFTVDMNIVFQDWVTDRLQRHLRGQLRVVSEPTEYLGVKRQVVMYPDLTFFAGDQLVYVGDVKYKITGSGLARNPDYYQLLAYATALGLPEGVLIYCQAEGGAPEREVVVREASVRLRTHNLSLSGSMADAEAAVVALAESISTRSSAIAA